MLFLILFGFLNYPSLRSMLALNWTTNNLFMNYDIIIKLLYVYYFKMCNSAFSQLCVISKWTDVWQFINIFILNNSEFILILQRNYFLVYIDKIYSFKYQNFKSYSAKFNENILNYNEFLWNLILT